MASHGTEAIIADAQRATGAVAAITGPSGFIGSRVTAHLAEMGYRVRALVHRHPLEPTVACHVDEIVHGSLSRFDSLAELVRGAQVVVHIGGLIRGSSQWKFLEVNAEGTRRLAEAVIRENPDRPSRFILISSLAARVPDVSPYARSKQAGEAMLQQASGGRLAWTVLRPPAVYGPGDRETLRLVRLVSFGIGPRLGTEQARFSLLHVDDLASAIAVVVRSPLTVGRTYELDDGTVGGHSWDSVFRTLGCGLGTDPLRVHVPRAVLSTAARLIALLGRALGYEPMLTPGKVAELTYPDWTCDNTPINRDTGWYPRISLAEAIPAIVACARERRLMS